MYFAGYLCVCVCVCVMVYVCMLQVFYGTVCWRPAPCIGQALPSSSLRGCSPILILLLWRGAHTLQNQAKPNTYQVWPGGHAPNALALFAPVVFPAGTRKNPVCASSCGSIYLVDDQFLFIRNHSSNIPLVDMTMRFWLSWCCFLIQICRTFLPDLLTSWVPWLHITSPRLSQVTSPRLSQACYIEHHWHDSS